MWKGSEIEDYSLGQQALSLFLACRVRVLTGGATLLGGLVACNKLGTLLHAIAGDLVLHMSYSLNSLKGVIQGII